MVSKSITGVGPSHEYGEITNGTLAMNPLPMSEPSIVCPAMSIVMVIALSPTSVVNTPSEVV